MRKFVVNGWGAALSGCRRAFARLAGLKPGGRLKACPTRAIVLALVLAALCVAQVSSQFVTADIRRAGDKLACLCGACKNTVATCPMLGCHYALPAREKIAKMQAAGMSDQAIVDAFVKETGLRALAVPPAEGFNALAWIMPFVAIGLGLIAIWLWIKKFHPKHAAPTPEIPPEVLARYQDRIDQDLTKQD